MTREQSPPAPAGAARERTSLAWSRSGISVVAIAASVVKTGLQARQAALGIGAGVVLLAVAVAVWRVGERRVRASSEGGPAAQPPRTGLALLTGATVFSAAVALVVLAFGRSS